MSRLACCDCGSAMIASPADAPGKLSLCPPCWTKAPQADIIRRSKEHEMGGHVNDGRRWDDPALWAGVSVGTCSGCGGGHVLRHGRCWNCERGINCATLGAHS